MLAAAALADNYEKYDGKDKDGEFLPKPSKTEMAANAKRWRDLYRLVERAWKERSNVAA